jgi:hypothetical protein
MDLPTISKKQTLGSAKDRRRRLEMTLASEIAQKIIRDSPASTSTEFRARHHHDGSLKERVIDSITEKVKEFSSSRAGRRETEGEFLFRILAFIREKCILMFGKTNSSFTSHVNWACLSILFEHLREGSRSSLKDIAHDTQELYHATRAVMIEELEELGVRSEAASSSVDKFALAFTFNVNPDIFDSDDTLLRFCRTRIRHNNTKPIQAMIHRSWKSRGEKSPDVQQTPPTFGSAFSMTRYETAKLCNLLSDQECRYALDLISRFKILP